ncbi:dTDP-4-dehydrorhamnose 3,5-epimerase family protein [Nakamurella lactea]|uniref:dTDP-4-dehydrorhamnose 3,5-epimerase family protein n=1 Tax=Nakamurella lactea TaxID=459515 RepID=UPI00040264CA|nr:dTDP-4-dehydrorhamnose 3,5-epimerase [Nakamurella lactea]
MTTPQITEMQVDKTAIDGLLVLTMKQVTEPRGTVREFFRASAYAGPLAGLGAWQQINITETARGGIRGLHGEAMVKLVACVAGEAFGAYLDAREGSPSYGAVVTLPLRTGTQVLVPAGVCNGFQSVSEAGCQYLYCFTDEWRPGMAGVGYSPLDTGLGIDWPIPVDPQNPAQVSAKDASAPLFSQLRT